MFLFITLTKLCTMNGNKSESSIFKKIQEIEAKSNIEIVLVKDKKAGEYSDIEIVFGIILMLITFTYFMFSKMIFGDYLFYLSTIGSFGIGYVLGIISGRFFIRKKRLFKNVELNARAIFQKSGIYKTHKQTGLLIYLASFEKKSFVIADTGAEALLSEDIIKDIQQEFDKVLKSNNNDDKIALVLQKFSDIFSKYIPKTEDDTNELPDNIKIEL